MAMMIKKNMRIMSVSLSRGKAEKRATISTFRPLILEIALRGLRTLNTLKLDGENPPSSSSSPPPPLSSSLGNSNVTKLLATIPKSRRFQESFKYAS